MRLTPDFTKVIDDFHGELTAIRVELAAVREILERLLELEQERL